MAKLLLVSLVLVMASFGGCIRIRASIALDPRLQHLGSIEGKSYYMDDSPTYAFWEALDFCNSSGLRMATIMSAEQHNFLVGKHPILGINKIYWIGAKALSAHVNYGWLYGGQFTPFQSFDANTGLGFVVVAPTVGVTAERLETQALRVLCESY